MSKITKKISLNINTATIEAVVSNKMIPTQEGYDSYCFHVKKGKYMISLSIKEDAWKGKTLTSTNYLDIKKDSYINIDDGYYGYEDLQLDHKKFYKKGCFISTGSDGDFELEITLTPVKKLGKDPFKETLAKAKKFITKNKTKKADDISEQFIDMFLMPCYYEEINHLIANKRSKEMQKLLDTTDKLLPKLNQK